MILEERVSRLEDIEHRAILAELIEAAMLFDVKRVPDYALAVGKNWMAFTLLYDREKIDGRGGHYKHLTYCRLIPESETIESLLERLPAFIEQMLGCKYKGDLPADIGVFPVGEYRRDDALSTGELVREGNPQDRRWKDYLLKVYTIPPRPSAATIARYRALQVN